MSRFRNFVLFVSSFALGVGALYLFESTRSVSPKSARARQVVTMRMVFDNDVEFNHDQPFVCGYMKDANLIVCFDPSVISNLGTQEL